MISFRFEGVVYPETLVMKGGKLMVIVQILSQVLLCWCHFQNC